MILGQHTVCFPFRVEPVDVDEGVFRELHTQRQQSTGPLRRTLCHYCVNSRAPQHWMKHCIVVVFCESADLG